MKHGLPAIMEPVMATTKPRLLLLITQATSMSQERCSGLGTLNDLATIKYDSAGQQQWVAIYNDFDNPDAQLDAMTIDKSGNVYVTGWSGILYSSHDVHHHQV